VDTTTDGPTLEERFSILHSGRDVALLAPDTCAWRWPGNPAPRSGTSQLDPEGSLRVPEPPGRSDPGQSVRAQ